MRTASPRSRIAWCPLDGLRSIIARVQAVQRGLAALHDALPFMPQTRVALTDAFHGAERDLIGAMIQFENVIALHHGELDDQIIPMVHGPMDRFWQISSGGRIRADRLPRYQWRAVADRLRSLGDEAGRIGRELDRIRGGKKVARRFLKASDFKKVRAALRAMATAQHPGWPDAHRIFDVAGLSPGFEASNN